mmetsp:Transcript_71017/g.199225  ORF Transcript_71017/g.199225 Transcript_71017/m.199225 type:complete len:294 (-) Transcript_71017:8-889(-)
MYLRTRQSVGELARAGDHGRTDRLDLASGAVAHETLLHHSKIHEVQPTVSVAVPTLHEPPGGPAERLVQPRPRRDEQVGDVPQHLVHAVRVLREGVLRVGSDVHRARHPARFQLREELIRRDGPDARRDPPTCLAPHALVQLKHVGDGILPIGGALAQGVQVLPAGVPRSRGRHISKDRAPHHVFLLQVAVRNRRHVTCWSARHRCVDHPLPLFGQRLRVERKHGRLRRGRRRPARTSGCHNVPPTAGDNCDVPHMQPRVGRELLQRSRHVQHKRRVARSSSQKHQKCWNQMA